METMSDSRTAEAIYEDVARATRAKQFDDALSLLEELPDKDKATPRYFLTTGQIHLQQKAYDWAEGVTKEGMSKFPANEALAAMLCRIHYMADDREKYQQAFRHYEAMQPRRDLYLLELERFHLMQGDQAAARDVLETALSEGDVELNQIHVRRLLHYLAESQDLEGLLRWYERAASEHLDPAPHPVLESAVAEGMSDEKATDWISGLIRANPAGSRLNLKLFKFLKNIDYQRALQLYTELASEFSEQQKHAFSRVIRRQAGVTDTGVPAGDDESKLSDAEKVVRIEQDIEKGDMQSARALVESFSDQSLMPQWFRLLTQLPDASQLKRPPIAQQGADEEVIVAQVKKPAGVVLIFTGANERVGMPIQLLDYYLSCLNLSVVYLKDFKRELFLGGIRSVAADVEGTVAYLRKLLDELECPRLFIVSSSGGSLGAIRMGLKLEAEKILCFGAATDLGLEEEDRAKLLIRRLRKQFSPQVLDVLPDVEKASGDTEIVLVYAEDVPLDVTHAQRLANQPGVRLMPLPYSNHNVMKHFFMEHDPLGFLREQWSL